MHFAIVLIIILCIIVIFRETFMENSKLPPVPKRGKYNFNKLDSNNSYIKLSFDDEAQAIKARTAACTYASLHKIKFVTRITDKVNLEVWRVAKPDPFFGEV